MIKDIIEAFSPSGNEENIREILKKRLRGVFDEISTDNMGNLVAKSGDGGGLCIECGMDSCGVMIVSKDENRAYFAAVGAVKPKELAKRTIVFANGQTGVVRLDDEADLKKAKLSDLYIETETNGLSIGDFGAVAAEFSEEEGGYTGWGLKNRIALAAVCEALEGLENAKNVTVLFSAQKRLGGRGLRAFFGANSFEQIITIDGCRDDGCVIVAKDVKVATERSLRLKLEEIAEKGKIAAQTVVSEENFFLEQLRAEGNLCGAVGISVICEEGEKQRVNKSDFLDAVRLIAGILETGGKERCL